MRKLIIALFLGVLFMPGMVTALGLGEIEVHSALNQQLDAEIELLSAQEGDTESLIIKLAPRSEFVRAGIDRPFMLGSLKFESISENGRHYVKVTTPKPVREPFLNFLVEADWPQGHIIREYTILLDPPIFANRKAPEPVVDMSRPGADTSTAMRPSALSTSSTSPMAAGSGMAESSMMPSAMEESSAVAEEPMQKEMAPMESESPPVEAMRSEPDRMTAPLPDGQYRVQAGDTAWSFAESIRPNEDIAVEKVMLALLRSNPEAFIHENVNGMKRGYILRIPDIDEINSISLIKAKALVREQNALWRRYQEALATGTPVSDIPMGKMTTDQMVSSSGESGGRLSIVGVDSTSSGVDPTSMSADELRNELALTAEKLETERLEKESLLNRVVELQQQLDRKEGMISIQDTDMAEMQSKASPAESMPESEETKPEEAMAPAEKMAKEASKTDEPTKQMEEAPKPVAPPKPVAKPKPLPKPEPAPEPGLLENPFVLMGGGLVLLIVIALVVLIVRRRRASSSEDEFDMSAINEALDTEAESDDTSSDQADHESTMILSPDEMEKTVIAQAETAIMDAVEPVAPEEEIEPVEEVAESVEPEAPAAPAAPAEEETDDVLAEADVYLAYGIFQQAEELLQNAIKEHPDREKYKVKLCETHYAAKDVEAFEAAAKQLHEHNSGAETEGWLKVASLGKDLCPDSDLFSGVNVEAADDSVVADQESVGMDLALDEDDGTAETDVDFSLDEPEGADDSLELPDLDLDEEPSAESDEPAELDLDGDSELEFDISETDALEGGDDTTSADDDFELDIEASELDVDTDDTSSEEASADEDEFVDDSLDFGLDELGSAETEDSDGDIELELGEDDSDDGLDLGMELDTGDDSDEDVDLSDIDLSADLDGEDLGDLDIDSDLEDLSADLEDDSSDDDIDISMDLEAGGDSDEGIDLSDFELSDDLASADDDEEIDISMDLEDTDSTDDLDMSDLDLDDSSADDLDMSDLDLGDSEEDSSDDDFVDDSLDFGESEDDDDLSGLDDVDEVSTKLDLARAYIDMGDHEGSRSILEEVIAEGNDDQKKEASDLLEEINS